MNNLNAHILPYSMCIPIHLISKESKGADCGDDCECHTAYGDVTEEVGFIFNGRKFIGDVKMRVSSNSEGDTEDRKVQ